MLINALVVYFAFMGRLKRLHTARDSCNMIGLNETKTN